MTSSVTVFCGSRFGGDPRYLAAARETGRTLAHRGTTLVYGGGRVGLMGAVADAALEAGGRVVGVIPRALDERELTHRGLSELHVVASMHERKAAMADLADAFVALPGGAGTIEELTEQWTWAQLGIHAKRTGLLDVAGYWQPFATFVDSAVDAGFVSAEHASILSVDDDVDRLLDAVARPATWGSKEPEHVPPA